MLDSKDRYAGAAWFVAGYLRGQTMHPTDWEAIDAATTEAGRALTAHERGQCLYCRRQGVVILDGYFCERCTPGIDEVAGDA